MRLLIIVLTLATFAAAQGPRIFIVTDMEGVGGVNNWDEQTGAGQRRYDQSCRLLAGEVNAAIAGALEAGASEVVVWDGHDSSRSISIEDIPPHARLIQGQRTPADYYLSDGHYDGIMFVGQHAKAGTPTGLLAHTQSRGVKDWTINGASVGEMGQTAAIGGYFKIPVIMLSGDQAACDEMLAFQPKAEVAAVKKWTGRGSSNSLGHEEAKRLIREAARRAVLKTRNHEFQPWVIQGPVEMKVEMLPDKAGNTPPPRVFRGETVLECYQAWLGKN